MNKYLKKTLITSASLLMFLSVGAGVNNVNAKHKHYHYTRYFKYHSRHHKRSLKYRKYRRMRRSNYKKPYVKHNKRSYRKGRKAHRRNRKSRINTKPRHHSKHIAKKVHHSKINTKAWRQAVASEELKLITKDRAQHGKAPLQETSELDSLAQMRAKQTYDSNAMFSSPNPHLDQSTGQAYDDEDAQQLGYDDLVGHMGENLAGGIADRSPKETAKKDNNMLYTEEEPTDGGHYQNIIGEYDNSQKDENYSSVGVGAYGNVIAEDFSFDNSNDDGTDENDDDITVNNNNNSSNGYTTSSTTYSDDGDTINNNNNSSNGNSISSTTYSDDGVTNNNNNSSSGGHSYSYSNANGNYNYNYND